MMRPALILLAASLLGVGCTRAPDDALFPLAGGRHWTYDVTTETANNIVEHEELRMSSLGRDTLDDGPAWRRRSESGVDYWLRSDDTGIYRVASKSDLDAEPKADQPSRYVLKKPLVAGTSWQATTTAYLLRRRQEFPPEIRHTHPAVPMTYVIDAINQPLATRAGEFAGCVRVKGTASLRLFADPVVGWTDMPLTTLEWYCPGVGLARLERHEPANSTFLSGGDLTMELVSWE